RSPCPPRRRGEPAKLAGAPIPPLLATPRAPDSRARYRPRRELRAHPADKVLAALKDWTAKLDPQDPRHQHHLVEALWTSWGLNEPDLDLLRRLLKSEDFHARAAAVRVLRYNTHRVPDHADLLYAAATDPHGRVRLEAIIAGSWLDNPVGKKVVELANGQPLDEWTNNAASTARDRLAGVAE